ILRFDVNTSASGNFSPSIPVLSMYPNGDVRVAGDVYARNQILSSSRELKENIAELSGKEAVEALKNLNPVKFNFKADSDKNRHIGFIAEDVPELVATSDRKTLSPMDIVAVLTQALKEQQNTISALAEKVKLLEAKTA
ncbi:tail fiber domain-containing protein, partial [Microcoleus sp. C2D2]